MNAPGAALPPESGLGGWRLTRRSLLVGAGATMAATAVGGVLAAAGWPSPADGMVEVPLQKSLQSVAVSPTQKSTLTSLAAAGTSFSVRPPAGMPLLLDPNKGNQLLVALPLASQGGLLSTTILPLAGPTLPDQLFSRVVHFHQPYSGTPVNPNLKGVVGIQPKWGYQGNGSVDVVALVSNDGRTWEISQSDAQPRATGLSALETVSGSPSASISPMSLPDPILEWSAADMLSTTANGATFSPGAAVGSDFSGSGNNLIVNVKETVTFRKGPLAGTRTLPSGVAGFPYVCGTSARGGMGCFFAGGPLSAWTILVVLAPGDQASGGRFDEEAVFTTRASNGGGSVTFALKYRNMGYMWDGSTWNNLYWNTQPFTTPAGAPIPTVVGWSSVGGVRKANPTMIAGSLSAGLVAPQPGSGTTAAPATIAGIDLSNSYAISGLLVYAAALTAAEMRAAALRLAYLGYGGTS